MSEKPQAPAALLARIVPLHQVSSLYTVARDKSLFLKKNRTPVAVLFIDHKLINLMMELKGE
jgi:hypothetical protein